MALPRGFFRLETALPILDGEPGSGRHGNHRAAGGSPSPMPGSASLRELCAACSSQPPPMLGSGLSGGARGGELGRSSGHSGQGQANPIPRAGRGMGG
ncbi:hypothetical protein chiPu_0023145, partial [Chiloscyllium punctatum]|nr:hypothetical protein [Chiloscyllium punctatum]